MVQIEKGLDSHNAARFTIKQFLGNVPFSFLPDDSPTTMKKRKNQWIVTHASDEGRKKRLDGELFGDGTEEYPLDIDLENEADIFLVFLAVCYFVFRNRRSLHLTFEDDWFEFAPHNDTVVISSLNKYGIAYPPIRSFAEIEADILNGQKVGKVEKSYYKYMKNSSQEYINYYREDVLFPLVWLREKVGRQFLRNADEAMWVVVNFINFVNSGLNHLR